jgi:hypothetical protein
MEKLILSESFKEMIERNKAQSRICKFLTMAEKLPLTIKGSSINYLTTREGGLISYLPKGRALKFTDDGKWARDGRQEARPSSVVNIIFSHKVLNKLRASDIEVFTNILRGFECTAEYTIVKGYDIGSVYDERSEVSSINGSCMQCKHLFEDNNGNDWHFLSLYSNNPDRVELLVFRNQQGQLIGRALKWLTDCGNIVIDRVYATEEINSKIADICYINGWYKKAQNTYNNKQDFIYKGESVKAKFSVTLGVLPPCVPYVDMFTYLQPLKEGGAILRNHNTAPDVVYNVCTNTDGYFSDVELRHCPIMDGSRYAYNFKYSAFYGCDVYKTECYTTDKGLIYDFHIENKERLIYKGRKYEAFEQIELFKLRDGAKFNKARLINRNELTRTYGYKLPNGQIIECSEHTTTERYKIATHPTTKEQVKVTLK